MKEKEKGKEWETKGRRKSGREREESCAMNSELKQKFAYWMCA